MIEADRVLLAELARLNAAIPGLAMRMMDNSASADDQLAFVRWMAAVAEALRQRAEDGRAIVLDGQVLTANLPAPSASLPPRGIES